MSFLTQDLGTPARTSDIEAAVAPLLARIAALEAQAQGDERDWRELLARVERLELAVATQDPPAKKVRRGQREAG